MEQNNSVIDLTGITFSPAPVPLCLAVIDLDDSIESQPHPGSSNESSRTESIPNVVITSSCHWSKKRRRQTTEVEVPKKVVRERSPRGRDFGDCPICFDYLGKNNLASTKCGHVFCLKCLEQALRVEKRCPACRKPVKGPSGYHPLYFSLN